MSALKMSFVTTTQHHPPNITLISCLQPSKSNLTIPLKHNNNFLCCQFPQLHNSQTRLNLTAVCCSPATITSITSQQEEALPTKVLDSTSDPPPIFDGTTRLYISYTCPYAQRVWITRNCKGLQDKIKLVPIDLKNRPTWYKDKVYSANKVPALEHNNEVIGESLDLIKFIDRNFEGPSLLPDDPAKQEFADVLFSNTESFHKNVTSSFKVEGVTTETHTAFDYLEDALSKFEDGPFFLGQLSLVDIAYIPFFERYYPFLLEVKKYDLTSGRPKLATWIQEMNKVEGYKQTQTDPKLLVESYKKRFLTKL